MDNQSNLNSRETTQLRRVEGLEGAERLQALIGNQILALNAWGQELRDYKSAAVANNEHVQRVEATPGAKTLDHLRVKNSAAEATKAAEERLKPFESRLNKLKKALGINLAQLSADLTAELDDSQAQAQIDQFYSQISNEEDRDDIHHRQLNETHKHDNHAKLSKIVENSRLKKPKEEPKAEPEIIPPVETAQSTETSSASIDEKVEVIENFNNDGGLSTADAYVPAQPEEKHTEVIVEPLNDRIREIEGLGPISSLTTDKLSGYYPGGETEEEEQKAA